MYEILLKLMNNSGISAYKLSKETGVTQATLSRWKTGKTQPSIETLKILADYFGVSVDFLVGKEAAKNAKEEKKEKRKAPALTSKDKRDIARDLESFVSDMESNQALMFDGNPMSDEARESIVAAMKLGLEAAKAKNKERFTPKKHRKE